MFLKCWKTTTKSTLVCDWLLVVQQSMQPLTKKKPLTWAKLCYLSTQLHCFFKEYKLKLKTKNAKEDEKMKIRQVTCITHNASWQFLVSPHWCYVKWYKPFIEVAWGWGANVQKWLIRPSSPCIKQWNYFYCFKCPIVSVECHHLQIEREEEEMMHQKAE